MPYGNVFAKINNEYYQLTTSEKKVADYVVMHQQKTQFMSISELAEECGLTTDRFVDLHPFYPTVGYCSEVIYTWLATGLHPVPMHLDEGEFLTPEKIPFAEALAMVLDGRIRDGKTVAGLLKVQALRAAGKL